jgi:hypothetical protein
MDHQQHQKTDQTPDQAAKHEQAADNAPPIPDAPLVHQTQRKPTVGHVLALQRHMGNRATQHVLAQAKGTPAKVQRAVGFEFEVKWPVFTLQHPPLTNQQKTGAATVPKAELSTNNLVKGTTVLARGTNFELQVDEGADDRHLEYVTTGTGFPETKAGRDDLQASMQSMQALGLQLVDKKASSPTKTDDGSTLIDNNTLTGATANSDTRVIQPWGSMTAEPQTTAGIRLDQIPALLESMAKKPGESAKETEKRSPARSVLAGKSNGPDTNAIKSTLSDVRPALTNFKTTQVGLPKGFGSESLVGFLMLISTYLRRAQMKVGTYAKGSFPVLAITDLGTTFGMLPPSERGVFTTTPALFIALCLDAAGMAGTGGTAVFENGFKNPLTGLDAVQTQNIINSLGPVTRTAWLTSILGGGDELSAQHGRLGLDSMGKYNHGETVGQDHFFRKDTTTTAPIFELRRLAGGVPVEKWPELALDIFDFIVALNDKTTNQFKTNKYK